MGDISKGCASGFGGCFGVILAIIVIFIILLAIGSM